MVKWLILSGINVSDANGYESNLQLLKVDVRNAAQKTRRVRLAFLNDASKVLDFYRCIGECLRPRCHERFAKSYTCDW